VEWFRKFGLVLHAPMHPVTGSVQGFTFGLGGAQAHAASFGAAARLPDVLPVRGNPYDPPSAPPAYPDLERTPYPREFRPEAAAPWSQVLQELSRNVKLPIVSDDYAASPAPRDRSGSPLPELAKLDLPAGLDALCEHYRCLWWYQDGVLFFRSRTWFIERLFEVPPRVLAELRGELGSRGRLGVRGLDALSRLSWRQLIGLNALAAADTGALKLSAQADSREYRLRLGRLDARRAHGFLQAWALLNPAQKRAVIATQGLRLGEMAPLQQEAFLRTLAVEYGQDLLADPGTLRLRIEQETALAGGDPKEKSPAQVVHLRFTCRDPVPGEGPLQERLSIAFRPSPRPQQAR
jgi:hypothetical protein